MRLIDADALKETLDYALSQHDDEGYWLEWFKQVIDAEKTVSEDAEKESV